jgi:elongation of very long chain fatty acids protein 7
MENRKPFQFRKLLIAYNFMHVLISFYLFWEGGMAGWFGQYNIFCEPYNKSTDKHTMRVRHLQSHNN